MGKSKQLLSGVIPSICLGLLTLLLVTVVVPAAAQSRIQNNPSLVAQTLISDPKSTIANPSELLERGRILYEVGQLAEAATVWSQAALGFAQQGDRVAQAWSLGYLSFAYQALGEWQQAKKAIAQSLNLLKRSPQVEMGILAQVLNIQGHLQSSLGQTEAALETWQQAEASYRAAEDEEGILGSQLNQAQILRRLGLYRQSQKILSSVQQQLQKQPDSQFKAQELQSLGVALQLAGELSESQAILEQSLAIAQNLNPPTDTGNILFSLGNTARDLQEPEKALDYYQRAATTTTSPQVKLETQLNLLRLYLQLEQTEKAIDLIPKVKSNLDNFPSSRTSIYAAVNFAESLEQLAATVKNQGTVITKPFLLQAKAVLTGAIEQAKTLEDTRAQAHALTQLGKLLTHKQQQSQALAVTKNALKIAEAIDASEIVARAAWQLGRLFQQQGDLQQATVAYQLAFNNLQSLRSDLSSINAEVQFSFQKTIEPIYRELVSLLLTSAGEEKSVSQTNLKQARQVIEALQLAELDNFFREACLATQPVQLDEIDELAATIYPIILPDRLEVIVSLPKQPLRNYTTYLSQAEIESILRRMRQSLNPAFSQQERLRLYQQAYSWLIEPAASELEDFGIKTLVFVLDGYLRNLPMAALYDGKQYLIEKYSTVLSPGLQLLKPQILASKQLHAIAAGLSEAHQGYQALPGVKQEIAQISSYIKTKVLLNQDFTEPNLQDTVDANFFPVLHLATHAQFSSSAEDTFILTWNGRINVKEFDTLVRSRGASQANRIELLVLSACQTAQGDSRAILGLAGVAVRSGASSTLATLWAVRDLSTTQLMTEFYQHLGQSGMTRAEALRRAQIALLKGEYNHPMYWAPFVLVGNWT